MTTDPEYQALLDAVIASPGDDLPRLVLADWWEENGQPERAEFCRVQCGECSCTYSHHNRSSTCARCYREAELWDANWKTWTPEEFWGLATSHRGCEFRRGFVAEIRCTLADWCGAQCRRCGGVGVETVDTGGGDWQTQCPTCRGTGGIIAHGPRIVREHPMERVVITDKRPWENTLDGGPIRFTWLTTAIVEGYARNVDRLPPEIFDRLIDSAQYRGIVQAGFGTPGAAHDALSAACLAWAQSQPVTAHPSDSAIRLATASAGLST